jgi:ribosomal protein L18E
MRNQIPPLIEIYREWAPYSSKDFQKKITSFMRRPFQAAKQRINMMRIVRLIGRFGSFFNMTWFKAD